MNNILKLIEKDKLSDKEVQELKGVLSSKKLSDEDIIYCMLNCKNVNWKSFINNEEDQHIFFVFEYLILKKYEPDTMNLIFSKFCDVTLHYNKEKITGFDIDFKIPKEVVNKLKIKYDEFREIDRNRNLFEK